MTFAFLLTLSGVFLFLGLHPFITYPLSLYLMPRRRRIDIQSVSVRDAAQQLSFAICVCAYNEEESIAAKAENLVKLKRSVPRCEVLVYIDGNTDRTYERLAPWRDEITIVLGETRRGKSYGMNRLVERVTADIVVFTDANVTIDESALLHLAPWFTDPSIGCVCGNLIYVNADDTAMSASGSLYWRLEEQIKQLESDRYSVIGADGSIFAIRRGLHEVVPDDIIDDFFVSMSILWKGFRVVREPKALAYERTATDMREEFRRKVRIACQAFNVHRLIWRRLIGPPLLLYCYVSHRLLKWIGAYNLALSALFLVAALLQVLPAWEVLLGIALLVGGFAVLVVARLRIAEVALAIITSFCGAGLGVWRSLRGDRFQTWTPTATARTAQPK